MTPDTTPRTTDETALLDIAGRRLPGGVLGTTRYRDELAFVVKRASGARLWDWSGREAVIRRCALSSTCSRTTTSGC